MDRCDYCGDLVDVCSCEKIYCENCESVFYDGSIDYESVYRSSYCSDCEVVLITNLFIGRVIAVIASWSWLEGDKNGSTKV